MTRWRAVAVGVVIELFLGFVGIIVPGIGQLVAGLLGGLVAGYLCRSTVKSGIWHGILAGSIGGFVLALPLGLLSAWIVTGVGLADLTGGLITGVGVTGLVVIAALVLAADSAIGGAVGALSYQVLSDRAVNTERGARIIEGALGPDSPRTPPEEREEIRVESKTRTVEDETQRR